MRVWITGCAGFLGSRLARILLAADHEVIGLSRRECSFGGKSVAIDLASATADEQLQRLLDVHGSPDVVVHAATLKPGAGTLADYVKSNVLATANLVTALKESPPRLLIYTSTLSVYSLPAANPVKESGPIRTDFPYALTKFWGEQVVETFQNQAQVVVLRLPSLYGAGQGDSFIDGLARLALRNEVISLFSRGETVRDALHVSDVVDAVVACISHPPQARFCRLNVGCGARLNTGDFVEALVGALGSQSQIVKVETTSPQQSDLYADIEEARRQIGFRPTPLLDSMKRYAGELQTES